MRTTAFDPFDTYFHLEDGPAATPLAVGPDFWEKIESRSDLHEGRLVGAVRFDANWDHWEMHPAGEELLYLLEGALDLVLDDGAGRRIVELRGRQAYVVPRGVWHWAIVHAPCEMIFVTRGAGTQVRDAQTP